MRNKSRFWSLALSGLTVSAGLVAGWAVLAGGETTQGLPPALPPAGAAASPTPALLEGVPDVAPALASLAKTSPNVVGTLNRIESAGGNGAAQSVRWRRTPCQERGVRGVTACEAKQLPIGTIVETWAPLEGVSAYELSRGDSEEMLRYLFDGRQPSVELVASRSDGVFVVVLGVTPAPQLSFPGAKPEGGANGVAVELIIDGSTGEILFAATKPAGSPPLEVIRFDEHKGLHSFEILGRSEAFVQRERSSHEELEAHSRDPLEVTPVATR